MRTTTLQPKVSDTMTAEERDRMYQMALEQLKAQRTANQQDA